MGGAYGGTKAGVDWHRGNQTTDFSDAGKYCVDLIVPEALSFLKRMGEAASKQPYFLYLPFHLIHGPNQVPASCESNRTSRPFSLSSSDSAQVLRRRCSDEALYTAKMPGLVDDVSAEDQGLCGVCACPSHSAGANVSWAQCRTVLGMAAALDWGVGSIVDALKAAPADYANSVIVYTAGECTTHVP